MDENKLLYYDVYGRVNRIYASHNRSYGFEQPYEHFHAKYELNFVVSSIPTRVKTLGRIYNIDKPHIRLHCVIPCPETKCRKSIPEIT